MDLALAFQNIHWLAVIVASVVAFLIGGLWYSAIFAKAWQKEINYSEESRKKANMGLIFGTTFVLNFIASVLMAMFLGQNSTLSSGLLAGLFVGVGWVATSLGTNYLFSQKTLRLFLIDAGYFACWFTAIGGILGAWK